MSDEEFDLSELSLEELYEQMGDDLYDGYQDEVVEGVEEALSRGEAPVFSGSPAGPEGSFRAGCRSANF